LLITLLLCSWDVLPLPLLYLSAYFEAHRQNYYDLLLNVSQKGAWEAWLVFFLRGVTSQSLDAVNRIQRLQSLREQYRARFQAARAASRLLQAVDILFTRPVFTVRQLGDGLGVNFSTAQRYINQLVEAGIVHEITGQARNRVYVAGEILRKIDEPVGYQAEG